MRTILVLAMAAALAGCDKKEEPPNEGANPTEGTAGGAGSAATTASKAAFEARRQFQTICATCHGPGGKGDGQAAAALNPKPRNYTDKAWQASVTDEEIKKIILGGGQAVGKSPVMPAQMQLANQPEVLDELVKIIRAFGK
jgi:cytochrome c553